MKQYNRPSRWPSRMQIEDMASWQRESPPQTLPDDVLQVLQKTINILNGLESDSISDTTAHYLGHFARGVESLLEKYGYERGDDPYW